LPQGMMYGRVEESDIPQLIDHPKDIPFSSQRLRGVPEWSKEQQAAAHFFWSAHQQPLSFVEREGEKEDSNLYIRSHDIRYSVSVSKEKMGIAIPASCGSSTEKELYRYVCHDMQAL